MLTVLCVYSGGYPPEYVARLKMGVGRNLGPHRFACLTSHELEGIDCIKPGSDWPGMWAKAELFNPELPFGRVLYIDITSVITGDLSEMAAQEGICITKDFYYGTPSQSVLLYDVGDFRETYEAFREDPALYMQLGAHNDAPDFGDQTLMNHAPAPNMRYWQDVLPGQVVSYKVHCEKGLPKGARVVKFHGRPRPHDVSDEWVTQHWHGGLHEAEFIEGINTDRETIFNQMRAASKRPIERLKELPEHGRAAALVAGGPSLSQTWPDITKTGADVFSMNGTHDWLLEKDIRPKAHVMLDARPENTRFVDNPNKRITYYVAAQCHANVFDRLKRMNVVLWWNEFDGVAPLCLPDDVLVGGGATVGVRSMCLAYVLGYRKLHLFGFDSCYSADRHHAYPQSMNDNEEVMEIVAAGRKFLCAPWMAKQAREFMRFAGDLLNLGVEVNVHGDGLIAHCARHMR